MKWPPSISCTNSGLISRATKFANAAVLLDIRPLADQIEMIGIGGVATQHAVLDLGARAVERVVVP